jgi:exopolysaccharide biosynthesis protein
LFGSNLEQSHFSAENGSNINESFFCGEMVLAMKLFATAKKKSTVTKRQLKKGGKAKKRGFIKPFFISFCAMMFFVFFSGVFLMYGPISYFRELWVTTAMSTLHHQWLATSFFNKATITEIMKNNRTADTKAETNAKEITVKKDTIKDNATKLPTSPSQGEHIINGVGFTRLKTSTYAGWVIRVFNPSRIYMAMASTYGSTGEQVSHMARRLGAFVGINAGGFIDVNGHGNGGKADKVLISKGKLIASSSSGNSHHIIGFDKAGRLLLTLWKHSKLSSLTSLYRDAVEFSPFLIVNGVSTTMYGNGGYGINPRTAIGQTKSGTVIFVQIDGRRPPVYGASVKELQRIFVKYKAYNAANLDGGSSSVFVYKGSVINNPSSADGERYVPDAFMIKYR